MIFCVVLLAVFFQLNQGFPSNPLDKTSGKLPSFIINGKYAKLGEYPHQLMMLSSKYICGAVLISPTQAFTAAHCFPEKNANGFMYLSGSVDTNSRGGQYAFVKKMVMHPKFNPTKTMSPYDFAILTFETPLKLNQNVQPIAWNQDENVTFAGEKCVLSGWGDTRFGETDLLKKVEMDVITNEKCQNVSKSSDFKIHTSHICAYTIGSGACVGDSGGPLTCQHNGRPILAGVASFVYTNAITRECNTNKPSVYSRISEFKNFIEDNLEN